MKLNQTNKQKFITNLKRFLVPLAILYVTMITGKLALDGHVVALEDFIPGSGMVTATILYMMNGVYDYLLKIRSQQ